MESGFWIDTWEKGRIGFHSDTPNPALIHYIDRLGLAPGARIFLPLCGKTRDIGWLLARGYRVCGVELSDLAIRALFDDLELTPTIAAHGSLAHYAAKSLDIYVGDIFALDRGTLGPVDAVYDRAALVALPEGMRARYAAHLSALTGGASQLLVCCDYDQEAMAGPPFSVDEAQVRGFYGDGYDVTLLRRSPVPGGIRDECPANQDVWLVEKKEEGRAMTDRTTGSVSGELANADARKARAAAWFRELRDAICMRFEGIEDAYAGDAFADLPAGRFVRSETHREGAAGEDAGGGEMSVMRGGRVFEKVGVNISTVHGTLAPRAQAMMASRGIPGVEADPRFWASGISLVAHMRSPKVPAVHMNTRHFWTPAAWWFGGGGDLNPMVPVEDDTAFFHAAYKEACDRHDPGYYPRYKDWADEYFMIKHRNFARGVGGIFYDDHNTGDWEADFALTRDVGAAFLDAHPPLVEKHMHKPWTEEERAHQLVRRGYYAEFNLVYDRGTKFGLETGHNIEAVLMSMPPVATWP